MGANTIKACVLTTEVEEVAYTNASTSIDIKRNDKVSDIFHYNNKSINNKSINNKSINNKKANFITIHNRKTFNRKVINKKLNNMIANNKNTKKNMKSQVRNEMNEKLGNFKVIVILLIAVVFILSGLSVFIIYKEPQKNKNDESS